MGRLLDAGSEQERRLVADPFRDVQHQASSRYLLAVIARRAFQAANHEVEEDAMPQFLPLVPVLTRRAAEHGADARGDGDAFRVETASAQFLLQLQLVAASVH